VTPHDPPRTFSSPACGLHELDEPAGDWDSIRAWRSARRKERLLRRMGSEAAERQQIATRIGAHLKELLERSSFRVLGIYWPIRGEIDVRDLARAHIEAGKRLALPVVVTPGAAVEFWQWQPEMPMTRGVWNIPVPAERRVLEPDLLIVPMVGYDRARYRLGYGGGYYDRTLAAAAPRPRTIGVARADAQLMTIYPQAHDIAMDAIVTEHAVMAETRS
jgi:5-formyltetrahydrofolate cyclo-ligase